MQPLTILKPSFWNSRREIQDASHGKVGYLAPLSVWRNTADGEVRGKKFRFSPRGWDYSKAEMTDASGLKLASIKCSNWWGTRYTITYNGVEYTWKPNGLVTSFTILQGEKEILRAYQGGYFKPGSATFSPGVDEKEMLPLFLFGLYYLQLYSAQMAAATGSAS